MGLLALIGQDSGMDVRVEGLYPPLETLGEARNLFHRRDRRPRGFDARGGRTGRNQLHTGIMQGAGELIEPGLVVNANEGATDGPGVGGSHFMLLAGLFNISINLAPGLGWGGRLRLGRVGCRGPYSIATGEFSVTWRPSALQPERAIDPTTSTISWRSTTLMRSCSSSWVSLSPTGMTRWAIIGPVSTPRSTRWTVTPVTFTPYARVSRTGLAPGNEGSSAGWVLMIFPSHCARVSSPSIRMKPAQTTMSGSCSPMACAKATSHCARWGKSFSDSAKVGTPACVARSSAPQPGTSLPTATIFAPHCGSACAANRAARLDPAPEARTTMRHVG